jgi:L-tryptophan--pyruvate aminotransferase
MMLESFWKPQRNHHIYVSHADSLMSYFVEKPFGELTGPWYVHEELDDAIREIHGFVGNAITWDKKIVVGNGSTQLLQAALFALASKEPDATPAAVVAELPYYSVSNFSLKFTLSYFLWFKLFFLWTT